MILFDAEPQVLTVSTLAVEDINANPSILPNTTINYKYIPVNYNPAVSIKNYVFFFFFKI